MSYLSPVPWNIDGLVLATDFRVLAAGRGIEGLGQLRLKRLWKEEGGERASLLSSAFPFRGGSGEGGRAKYCP